MTKLKMTKLSTQAKAEYDHALDYREKRHAAWLKVEDLYYGKKKQSLVTRANVHIPKMQGTIETFLSKVDDAPYLQFEPMEEGDKKAAKYNNTLLEFDRNNGDWDLIDLMGKKEAAMYGRTIYKKYSTGTKAHGYEDNFELLDVFDFLIDPMAGGLKPIESARYLGQDNIIRTIDELKGPDYDQKAVKQLQKHITSDAQADSRNEPKDSRRSSLKLSDAVLVSGESVKLTEWYTTFEGEDHYLLMDMTSGLIVRHELLADIFPFPHKYRRPFATWAPFPRATEFWTPGLGELIAEPNVIQNIVMSQILDNNTFRNYGMKAYNAEKVMNPAQLTPRPQGKIAVTGNPREVVMDIPFPSLDNALQTYRAFDQIIDKETGITANAKGAPNSKRMSATEFAGLLDQVGDRFLTSNKTYKHTLKRVMNLYYYGLQQNMTRERAIRIIGADGYEYRKAQSKDLKMNTFDVLVSSGLEDEQNKNLMRDRFGEFIGRWINDPSVNKTMLKEKDALNSGLTAEETRRFLSPDNEGDWEILSEAAKENEILLTKEVKPNKGATTEHIQRHVDFMKRMDDLDAKQTKRFLDHIQGEMQVVVTNEQNILNRDLSKKGQAPDPLAARQLQSQPPAGPASFTEGIRQEAIARAPQPLA